MGLVSKSLTGLRDVGRHGYRPSDDGQNVTGSVIILDCTDRAQAEAFAAADPYSQADLFQSVQIKAWRKVLPAD